MIKVFKCQSYTGDHLFCSNHKVRTIIAKLRFRFKAFGFTLLLTVKGFPPRGDKRKLNRALIVYYSRSGQHYFGGAFRYLKTGNTEQAAHILQALTGADLFRIEPVTDYSEDYCRCIDQARQDILRGTRPALKGMPSDMEQYETVLLGYPNFWGTMPAPVFSFLEQVDLARKTVCPFCTHEGDGMGKSEQELKKQCPAAHILSGLPLHGSELEFELSAIKDWIESIERQITDNKRNIQEEIL